MNGVLKFLQSRASISSRFSLVHRDFQNNVDPIKHVFQYRNVSSSFAKRKLKFKNLSSIFDLMESDNEWKIFLKDISVILYLQHALCTLILFA